MKWCNHVSIRFWSLRVFIWQFCPDLVPRLYVLKNGTVRTVCGKSSRLLHRVKGYLCLHCLPAPNNVLIPSLHHLESRPILFRPVIIAMVPSRPFIRVPILLAYARPRPIQPRYLLSRSVPPPSRYLCLFLPHTACIIITAAPSIQSSSPLQYHLKNWTSVIYAHTSYYNV